MARLRSFKSRDTALEGVIGRVRLISPPFLKERILDYAVRVLGGKRLSRKLVELKWKGKRVTIRDEGVLILDGAGSDEDFEELQLLIREKAVEELLKELACSEGLKVKKTYRGLVVEEIKPI